MSQEIALEEEFARVPLRRATLKRLARYLAPHRFAMGLGLFIEFAWVWMLVIDAKLIQLAVDGPLSHHDASGVLFFAGLIALNSVVRGTITVFELRLTNRVGVDVLHAVRAGVFDHIQRLSMRYFDRTKQGRILARADRDVDALEHLLTWGPVVAVSLATSIVAGFVRIGSQYVYLLPYLVAALPVLWGVTRVFERFGFPAYRRIRETHAAVSAHVAESITGVRVIKAFTAEEREGKRLGVLQDAYRSAILTGARISNGFVPSLSLAIQALLVVALLLGAREVLGGRVTVGELLESVLLLGMVLGPVEGLGSLYNESLVAGAAAERIFLLLDTVPEVQDAPDAVDAGRLSGEVEFDRVSFAYDPTDGAPRQLHEVSLRAAPGERIALVGHTGAGKTSILNLLARFYEPQGGTVRFDGRDAKTLTAASVHRQMGIVLQENFLFAGSVLENLRFVRSELTEAEAREGFRSLGCLEVLDGFSAGLSTDVGERGANLSEGERQIVCFARALLADPSILILDEATSAVDTRTEALILRALDALSSRQTTFVIAHRLSTVRHADRILVLDHGRIVEQGRHADLISAGGAYANLYREYAR